MLRKIIKFCETLLKAKEVFAEAYESTSEDFYDPSADNIPIYYSDEDEVMVEEFTTS